MSIRDPKKSLEFGRTNTDNLSQPGPPTANTWGGTGSMMEVGYVAHYVSK